MMRLPLLNSIYLLLDFIIKAIGYNIPCDIPSNHRIEFVILHNNSFYVLLYYMT